MRIHLTCIALQYSCTHSKSEAKKGKGGGGYVVGGRCDERKRRGLKDMEGSVKWERDRKTEMRRGRGLKDREVDRRERDRKTEMRGGRGE